MTCGPPGTPCTRRTCTTGTPSPRSRRVSRTRRASTATPGRRGGGRPARGAGVRRLLAGASPRAQRLAQTRPGAKGALLYESCIPITGEWAFGPWPDGVPVQIHGKEGDEFFEEDLPAARELVEMVGPELAELFVYPGDAHLFTDRSLPAYDAEAAGLVLQRSLDFLDGRLRDSPV